MAEKNSFVLYTDYLQHIELLDMEQRGELFTAIMLYASGKETGDLDGMVKMAFSFIKNAMNRDMERYASTVEARREAGKKGGRPKESGEKANGFSEKQIKAKKANGFSEKQIKAKKPDNDNVNDNDNDNVNVNDKTYKTICAEPETGTAPVARIELNDGSEYEVPEKEAEFYKKIYPGVDVISELNKMAGWAHGNPTKRKTRRGISKFINTWLAKEQDKAKISPGKTTGSNFYDDMREWVNEHESATVCSYSIRD